MKYQIIYSSISSVPMEPEDLEEILMQARSNNSRTGITGALVYVDRFFLQILEGEKVNVQNLFNTIFGDIRHEVVTLIQETEISQSDFADWEMAYISATPEEIAKWAGLSTTSRLPEVISNIRQSPERALQVAQNILSILAIESEPQSKLK
ncbi:MAG: BLUF domain-containing protein [Ideonella sp.]